MQQISGRDSSKNRRLYSMYEIKMPEVWSKMTPGYYLWITVGILYDLNLENTCVWGTVGSMILLVGNRR